jgi:polysaccharide pyruvyl transferase WcaK-like protein
LLLALDGLDAVAAAIARARLVIGVRLHALVLAVRFGVPFLYVPYDPKITGLVDDVRYALPPLWAPGTRVNVERIDALVDDAWGRHALLASHLTHASAAQRELASENFTALARLLR